MGKPWKELEKKTAEALGGIRINRASDYGVSDVDVVVPGFDFIRLDCKYRKSWAHHAYVEEVRSKYCTKQGQYPALVTKHHHSHREYVTVDLPLLGSLLLTAKTYAMMYRSCLERLKTHLSQNGTREDLLSLLKSLEEVPQSALSVDMLTQSKEK